MGISGLIVGVWGIASVLVIAAWNVVKFIIVRADWETSIERSRRGLVSVAASPRQPVDVA